MLNGIQSLNYGVEDVSEATRFLEDFGLPLIERTDESSLFQLAEGSHVAIRNIEDPGLPKSGQEGFGVREVIWGVDDSESFHRYVADLGRDHELTESADGTVHFVTDFGQAMGLKQFSKLPVVSSPCPVNAPGLTQRFNQWRKWRLRAQPKQIMHAVFAYPDVNAALEFFRSRLHFRLTEVQEGIGVYLRAAGSSMHHNIALLDANFEPIGAHGKLMFNHANFVVEDIDELMVGKTHMERQGWPKSPVGLGRHRIGSALFLYIHSPLGGEIEYGADVDAIDDTWVPHIWSMEFGYQVFVHNLPSFLMKEPEWKFSVCDGATAKHVSMTELADRTPKPKVHSGQRSAAE
jgi:catechol 2,3-dioxygenase-like lactoylglutathione lyase family enzyme